MQALTPKDIAKKPQTNEQIRAKELRVIDAEGENRGTMPTSEALALAKEQGQDLVVVTEKANPPVAKIIDYGKYVYQQQKKEKQARSGSKQQELKSIQVRVKTDDHDLKTKAAHVERFLKKGHRVRVHIYLRGREKAHKGLAREKLQTFLNEYITVPHKAEPIKGIPTGFSTIITPE